jgi:PAS domain S-box-containing protein
VVGDVDRELAPADGADTFNSIGIKAIVCCPLVKGGRLAAMMAVHQNRPRQWTADEVRLVEAVVERSWAYIERARVDRALKESEAQFRLIADAMPQIVWVTRPDGYHEYYNSRWYEFLGLDYERTKGDQWANPLHPDDAERARQRWKYSLDTGETYEIEYRFRRHDGEYRWFLARALPVRVADGRILRWYGTCTDIHEQKQFQTQREELLESERSARAEAERASRMKDEFLATLGHELRTPLNAILGWATILQGEGAAEADDLREGLEAIERNARAQTQIIEDLLDMSRIISGKVRLDVQQVDLAAVVRGAVETVKHGAEAKAIRVQAVLDPLNGPVYGDPGRLQQVFWNLLTNAIKFTPKGGRVQVLLQRVNSHVEVRVTDSGEGMRPEFLPYVFDRFKQADASTTRRHGGLGLGLGIVKQLVELHGGTVTAQSAGAGHGSTFVVMLPVSPVQPSPKTEPERRHPRAASFAGPLNPDDCKRIAGLKILVVDDEADSRAVVQRLLEACDAVVLASGSAADALERVKAEPPDVLVSDIGMPGEDGYSLIRRVRALGPERGGNIPAVALTAYARSEDRTRSVLAGFQMHIAKPVEPSELIAVVASLAGRTP